MSTYWLSGCEHAGPIAGLSLEKFESAHGMSPASGADSLDSAQYGFL